MSSQNTQDDVRAAMAVVNAKEETISEPVEAVVDVAVDAGSDGSDRSGDAAPAVRAEDSGGKGERVRGPDGKFTKTTPAKVEAKAATPAPVAATAATTPTPAAAVTTPTAFKAPQSWKADVRERFNALPPEVQAEIIRVENDTKQALQGASEPKKFHETFKQAVAPYEREFQARGMNSLKAVTDLLPTALALHTGSPEQKAQTIAQAIQAFGIPVEALAKALDATPARQQPQAMDPASIAQQVEQRIMQQFQQRQMQTEQQAQLAEVEKFATGEGAEFIEDVRISMAGLIDSARHVGQTITLQDAYDQACWAVPSVRAIIQAREAAKQTQAQTAAAAKAKSAAVSVRSAPAVSPVVNDGPTSTIDDIRAAMAQHSGGGTR